MEELGQRVATTVRDADPETFASRVASEAEALKGELEIGTFDNPQAIVGLEYEFSGVDEATGELRRVPRALLDTIGFEKELGLHNAEVVVNPQPLGPHGLAAIQHSVQSAVATAHDASTRCEHIRLASDGFWAIPPTGETAADYFSTTETVDGMALAENVSDSVRYHALSNSDLYRPRRRVEAPNVSFACRTVVPASLTTTVQPHYQMPIAADLPTYFRYALRVAGPLLALAVNSPLFPPSLYDDDATVADVLADGHRENRVFTYESVMNDPDRPDKVRFPRDVESTAAAVDRIASDPPIVPRCLDADSRFDDRFVHLRYKHGSYWRWVRPVFEGATTADANARIEFRPLPAQPTVRDSVAFLAALAGLLRELVATDHPVRGLSWEQARENFYSAARDGLDADLVWLTADGERTTAVDDVYADLFRHAQRGLERRGFDADGAARYLWPLRQRVDRRTTPAGWKRDRLREYADRGRSLAGAVTAAQRDYIHRQAETLVEGVFTDWPDV
jgi:hypothetical protein